MGHAEDSLATTSKGGWHLGAMICPGNPYDGHTLDGALEQLQRLHGKLPAAVFVVFQDRLLMSMHSNEKGGGANAGISCK